MPVYRRLYADGGTYFLTLCLDDRRSDLLVRHVDLLRLSWRDCLCARACRTVAAVVLPDHMHFLWRLPDDDHDYNRYVAANAGRYSRVAERTGAPVVVVTRQRVYIFGVPQ